RDPPENTVVGDLFWFPRLSQGGALTPILFPARRVLVARRCWFTYRQWSPPSVVTCISGHLHQWSPASVVTSISGHLHQWSPASVVTSIS
ncbi:hypothetical protein BaRGS_00038256, partial [Batillaria attramentaria]